jgi:S-DNA-T family DNA segregation ATPase FtsK/SpoIIIE
MTRVHGAYIADDELKSIIDYVKSQGTPIYNEELMNEAKEESGIEEELDEEKDELFDEALKIIKDGGSPTISYIQRRLKIGYNRSARIVEQMEKMGILSKPDDKGKRELLI